MLTIFFKAWNHPTLRIFSSTTVVLTGPMPCQRLWSSTSISGQARILFTFLGLQWGSLRWVFNLFFPETLTIHEKLERIEVLPLFARSEFELKSLLLGAFSWNDHSSNHRTFRAFDMNAAPWVAESWLLCHRKRTPLTPLLFFIHFTEIYPQDLWCFSVFGHVGKWRVFISSPWRHWMKASWEAWWHLGQCDPRGSSLIEK